MMQYAWPGNVRELRNLVEHLVFLGPKGVIAPQHVLPHLDTPPRIGQHLPMATNKTPDQSERELIYFALLDLKREVAEIRNLLEERDVTATEPQARPIYAMEDQTESAPATEPRWAEEGIRPATSLKDLERAAIVQALERVDQNRRKAAELLGIGERTLYRELDEYGLR